MRKQVPPPHPGGPVCPRVQRPAGRGPLRGRESVDEFYSENLAQEVTRGMREAAARGFFLGSRAPFGYRRVKVSDCRIVG